MVPMKDLIVGTAGHIDHGKTALVHALTGIDTDRLIEEKRRGITIDIGFAHTRIGEYRIGFVDVPGHEKFVKNMLAGIGGIQFLLLVLAADESIMPQTVEHFLICSLLEIPSGIIVITKRDQVDQEILELVHYEAKELVKGSFLEDAPICSVDSISGTGITELKESIQKEVEALDRSDRLSPPVERMFRMPIDRVFTVKGFGTVVTGTPQGGEIHQEEPIAVYPGGQTGKIRGIQIFGEKTNKVRAGQRTALNLSGIDKEVLERGMVLGSPKLFKVSRRFDVSLRLLKSAPSALRSRDPIRFHHGSGEIVGRVYLKTDRKLEPGQSALAQIRLDDPTVCFPSDRFILRRYSPLTTIGGGIVLDGNPIKWRKKHREEHIAKLRQIESAFKDPYCPRFETLIEYYVGLSGTLGIDLGLLGSYTGLNQSRVQEVLDGLETIQTIPMDPPVFVTTENLAELKEKIVNYLKSYHQNRPLSFGSSREELKERFLPGGSSPYFQFLLNTWQSDHNSIETRGSSVAIKGSKVSLTPAQEDTKARILDIIERSKLTTPTLDEVVQKIGKADAEVRNLLYYLLETGEILRISGDMVLLPSQLKRLEDRLRRNYPAGTTFSVSEFKELFSVSRKYAIPLLELLDRRKVTRRTGEARVVI